jgi:type I restriction enzyme, S subunit
MGLSVGYKKTELGMIPEEWAISPLSALCRSICDGTHFTPRYVSHGVPFYSVENVTANDFSNTKFISESEHAALVKRCRPERGDILMTRIGSLGETKLLDWDVRASIYVSLALLKPNAQVHSRYLYVYSRSRAFVLDVERRSLLNAAPKKINMGDIGAIPVPVPGRLVEQEAIAEALSDADFLVESLEHLLTKKRLIKRGVMQELLTGKRRLSGFDSPWQEITVGEVISRHFCGPSPTCEERNVADAEEWGVLKTTAVTWEAGWDWTKHKTLPKAYWNQPQLEIKAGDVIVTKAGPRHRVGVAAWVDACPRRIIVSGKMIALRPDQKKAVPLMLASAISEPTTQTFLDQRTTGMAESQVNFENGALLRTPIRLPQIEEQIAIASIITDMSDEIAVLESKLSKARQLKDGMTQSLLTGAIRLV